MSRLIKPTTYEEFFKIRVEKDFLQPFFSYRFNRFLKKKIKYVYYLPKFVTFDVLNSPENIIETIEEKEIIQFGGKRNLFSGVAHLHDYVEIDLNEIKLPKEGSHAVLISPLLNIPRYFVKYACRWNNEILWNNGEKRQIKIVPSGQFFRLKDTNIETIARYGISRKHPFGKIGYGEFIIHNWNNGD